MYCFINGFFATTKSANRLLPFLPFYWRPPIFETILLSKPKWVIVRLIRYIFIYKGVNWSKTIFRIDGLMSGFLKIILGTQKDLSSMTLVENC